MKAKAFKSAFLIIALLIQTRFISAQVEFWTAPLPISDSVSDNRNAIIKYLFYNDTWDNFIFWERSLDSNSTEICSRNFYTQDEPVAVVTGGNYHYTDPRIIYTFDYNADTLFYIFYQSDQNGNADIFYKIYTIDGYTEPQLFAGTSAEESHFRCNDGGYMVWQEGGKINFSKLTKEWNEPFTFSDPLTIDSNNCSSPEIPPAFSYGPLNYITWLKKETDSASVWYCVSVWDGSWSEPYLLYGLGNNKSTGFAMSVCPYTDPYNITFSWENISGDSHTIYAYRFESDYFTSEFHQENDFLPMIGNLTIPVDDFFLTGLMTFVNSDGQNDEIYVSDDFYDYISPYPEDYINLSQSPYRETNPKLFNGTCPIDVCDLILTWESYRNEHWQLFYSISQIACYGSIDDESAIKESTMNISPNPVRNEFDINYTLTEDAPVSLQLCTLEGRQILLSAQKFLQKGDYTYHLNFDQIFPGQNYSGLFMVRLQAGESSVTQKVIKMH